MSQATTAPAAEPAPEVTTAPSAGNKRTLMLAVGALVAGAAVGKLVVAPRLFPVAAATSEHAPAAKKSHGKEGEASPLFRIENVIVNPAGSAGTRYLVVSVGIEVDDPKAELTLRASEVQLRDAITGLLERQTLQALTGPGARESIRAALVQVVKPFVDGATAHVYIPQFLIQ